MSIEILAATDRVWALDWVRPALGYPSVEIYMLWVLNRLYLLHAGAVQIGSWKL